jgi:hypothetical protein
MRQNTKTVTCVAILTVLKTENWWAGTESLAPRMLAITQSGSLVTAARNIGQNVRTALHLAGCGIGDCHIEKLFNLEEQAQFIQRVEPQIF